MAKQNMDTIMHKYFAMRSTDGTTSTTPQLTKQISAKCPKLPIYYFMSKQVEFFYQICDKL